MSRLTMQHSSGTLSAPLRISKIGIRHGFHFQKNTLLAVRSAGEESFEKTLNHQQNQLV
jgi:hypothetical protein